MRRVCISPPATGTLSLVIVVFSCNTSSLLANRDVGKSPVPGLEADQRVLDTSLVVFGHVLMHVGVVLSDVSLRAAVGDSPESEGGGVGVGTLELQGRDEKRTRLQKMGQRFFLVCSQQREPLVY